MSNVARPLRVPAPALVAVSSVSSQTGAAIATRLFSQVGPTGALTLRIVFAAVALWLAVRPRRSTLRLLGGRDDLLVVAAFGLALAGMNLSFYEAIARVPLGVAVTVEFVGPLTLAVVASRHWSHVVWALLAALGVFLLAGGDLFGSVHRLDLTGVCLALLAGAFWAAYILLNAESGKRFPGTFGLAAAMAVGAVVIAPLGIAGAGARLLRPDVLAVGLAVAVLSSAAPYSCEVAALRRVSPRAFGILLSMAPAIAALAGFAILGQHLSPSELAALFLVMAANVGSSWFSARRDQRLAALGPADARATRSGSGPAPVSRPSTARP